MATKVQMHGLENVDKTDETSEATTPTTPVEKTSTAPLETNAPISPSQIVPAPVGTSMEAPPSVHFTPSVTTPAPSPLASPAVEVRTATPPVTFVNPAATSIPSQMDARRPASFTTPSDWREHKYRVPRTFRFDVDLLEYIERHEKYRAALENPRTFTEKINDWVRAQMAEENPVLLQAEADVMGLRGAWNARRSLEEPFTTSAEELVTAIETHPPEGTDETTKPVSPPQVTAATASVTPLQKRGPSIWELEKQVKRSRTGTL